MKPATRRQIEYLRNLGYKGEWNLSATQAIQWIDWMLGEEERTGTCTLKCPYCKAPLPKRPKRTAAKCSKCKRRFYHLAGKLYTENRKAERDQNEQHRDHQEWLKESRQMVRDDVRDCVETEKEFSRDMRACGGVDPMEEMVGFVIRIGPDCHQSRHLDGLLVPLADAKSDPALLPPYPSCVEATCGCTFDPVSRGELPKGIRVAERAKPRKAKGASAGCLARIAIALVLIVVVVIAVVVFLNRR